MTHESQFENDAIKELLAIRGVLNRTDDVYYELYSQNTVFGGLSLRDRIQDDTFRRRLVSILRSLDKRAFLTFPKPKGANWEKEWVKTVVVRNNKQSLD